MSSRYERYFLNVNTDRSEWVAIRTVLPSLPFPLPTPE